MLNGCTLQVSDEDGEWIIDDSFLLLINAADQGVDFKLPSSPRGKPWRQIVDTENIDDPFISAATNGSIIVGGRALKLLSDAEL
jgi:glycogen operon protein